MEYVHKIKSPVGVLTVSSDGDNVTGLWIEGQKYFARTLGKNATEKNISIFEDVRRWLDAYFSGKKPDFTPPLMPAGSTFQKAVWEILREIPYGKTVTYREVTKQYEIKNKDKHISPRVVGGAVGCNPVSIIIPCHRVIGTDGSLKGYAGGIAKKIQLLRTEGIDASAGEALSIFS